MFKTVLMLSSFIAVCLCAVSVELPNKNAAKGTCLSSSTDVGVMKAGERKQVPNQCVEVSCNNDGTLNYIGCGVATNIKGERCENDLSKPYPDCCATC